MTKDIDPRRKAILHSAWHAFAAYGFRKTSMDDIARGAGLSRPALYLHYRNKEDIFRSLAQFYYDEAAESLARALERDGPPSDVLAQAFEAESGAIVEDMLASPHGAELVDTKGTTSADIAEAGEARLTAIYEEWLRRGAEAGRLRLPGTPAAAAEAIVAAHHGIKSAGIDHATYRRRARQLAALLGAGLAA